MKRPGFNGWEFSRIEQRHKWKCPLKLKQEKYKLIHSQPYRELENIRVGYSNPLGFLFIYLFLNKCFIIIIFLLYNIVLVLPYINMNPPWVYTCSQSWTPLPPPSPYHPSGSSQCTSPKHPVSFIEPGLVICFLYDIIHVSMPFSQFIPPLPSPTESKRLFYISVSLLLSRIQGYRYKMHVQSCDYHYHQDTKYLGLPWWSSA